MDEPYKKGPLTGGHKPKRDRWYSYKGANEAEAGDAHFDHLSERFWGFASQMGFAGGERTLGDVLADLWRARLYVLAGALAGCILAGAMVLLAIPQTRVSMLIAPANPMNDSGGAMLDDRNFAVLRFLAQRAGVDNTSGFTRFENIYDGVSVAKILMNDPKIMAIVRADRRFVFLPGRQIETPEALADYFSRKVRLEPEGVSSYRRLQYWHASPLAGQYLITRLHDVTDRIISQSIQLDARERIAYLNAKLEEAVHPEHRRALTDLLLEQERALMLASIDQPYAARIIEEPSHYYKPQWPAPLLWFAAFMAVGAFAGFIVFGARQARA